MSTKTDRAIAKITEEAMAIDEPLAFAIEEYLTGRCTNTATAQKILDESKKLQELYDQLVKKAMGMAKPLKGNTKVKFTAFDIEEDIAAYYGLDSKPTPIKTVTDRVDVLDLF